MTLSNLNDITWSDYSNVYTYTKTYADIGTHNVFGTETFYSLGFVKDPPPSDSPHNFTAMAWVYWTGDTSTNGDYGIIGNNTLHLTIRVTSGVARYYMGFFGGGHDLVNGPIPTANTWQHIAFVYDYPVQKIYLNGVLHGITNTTYSYGTIPNTNIYLGTWWYPENIPYNWSRNWKGYITNIAIFNVALDGTVINGYKNEYLPPSNIPYSNSNNLENIKHCCPPKVILDRSHSTYKEGQNASKLFTRINTSRYSRVKRTIHISQSNITNICDPRIKLNIDINTDIQNNQSHLDNINRLNNSINCTNRKRFGAFLAGLKNA